MILLPSLALLALHDPVTGALALSNTAQQQANTAQQQTSTAQQQANTAQQQANTAQQQANPAQQQTSTAQEQASTAQQQQPVPQQPAPQQQPTPQATDKSWMLYDRVMMIVNQDMITERQLWRDLASMNRERPLKDESERRAAQQQILTERVKKRLMVQAGQDLPLDVKLVDRNVQDRLERAIENRGGAVAMSKYLEEKDLTLQEVRKVMRDELYASIWQDSITGDTTAGARPKNDRFVRPGLLAFHFNNVVAKPETYAALGGKSELFVLQTLLLDVDRYGGVDATTKLALELKKRIDAGEDMGAIVEQYSYSIANKGVSDPADLGSLKRFDVRIADFAAKAKVGEVSDVITQQGTSKTYLRLVRMVDHTQSTKPDLTQPDVQAKITQNVRKDLEDYRVGRALQVLLKASYVWPKELNQQ